MWKTLCLEGFIIYPVKNILTDFKTICKGKFYKDMIMSKQTRAVLLIKTQSYLP